jgi:hypothetical protein
MLWENLAISSAMVIGTVCLHFIGLATLIAVLRAEFATRWRQGSAFQRGATILFTVFGLVVLHSAEIWVYASLFVGLGHFEDFETALYFSTTSFTTLGYGDVVISHNHRLIGAIESANGFLLIGWSTAFLVSVTAKIGLLEAQLERAGQSANDRSANQP